MTESGRLVQEQIVAHNAKWQAELVDAQQQAREMKQLGWKSSFRVLNGRYKTLQMDSKTHRRSWEKPSKNCLWKSTTHSKSLSIWRTRSGGKPRYDTRKKSLLRKDILLAASSRAFTPTTRASSRKMRTRTRDFSFEIENWDLVWSRKSTTYCAWKNEISIYSDSLRRSRRVTAEFGWAEFEEGFVRRSKCTLWSPAPLRRSKSPASKTNRRTPPIHRVTTAAVGNQVCLAS